MSASFFRTRETPPPVDEWVLAYWPHMDRSWDRNKRAHRLHGGWYLTRLRQARGFQTQFSGSERYYVGGVPPFWTAVLKPTPNVEEVRRLEALVRRYRLPTQRAARNRALRQLEGIQYAGTGT